MRTFTVVAAAGLWLTGCDLSSDQPPLEVEGVALGDVCPSNAHCAANRDAYDLCYRFPNVGQRCTRTCTSSSQCAPGHKCNSKGVCRY